MRTWSNFYGRNIISRAELTEVSLEITGKAVGFYGERNYNHQGCTQKSAGGSAPSLGFADKCKVLRFNFIYRKVREDDNKL